MSAVDHELIEEIRDSARDFLQRRDQRQRKRHAATLDREYWQEIAAVGWLGMSVPEARGGLGLGWHAMAAVMEEAGRAQLPEPLAGAGVLSTALLAGITPGGDAGARDRLLEAVCAGTRIVGLAWQETEGQLEAGEAAGAFGVTVTAREGAYVLNGEKRHVIPGADADGWLVTADGEQGTALFYVAAGTPGVAVQAHERADGSAACHLVLESAVVPHDALLSREGVLDAVDEAIDYGRLMQSAELVGVARQVLEDSVAYLNTRQQFGQLLSSFQALQHRLVDGLIQVELADACLREALATVGDANMPGVASRVKARCAHAATEMTRMAIQLHGAIGTTNEYDIGLYFKRAMTLASRWGNAAAHRRRFAQLALHSAPREDGAVVREYTEFPNDLDWAGMPEPEFRRRVRALFATHYPPHRRFMPYRQTWAESREWYLTLSRLGWIAPAWPREHGGMGLPADKLIAYIEESEAWGVARPPDQGLVMVGPILMRFGTEEQRRRFLPKILAGEQVWTQGYSEPNAGSDLAAVRTEAVLDGDHFVVNGQKTWTTWGADGTHMFMLVRTDKTVKKQAGISFLLVDLKSPGVTVRPIRNIAAEQEFCEVFFDDVRVPRENLVGELNQGWTVAKALLGFERLFTGSPKHSQHTLHQVEKLARQRGLFDDAAFVARFAELQLDTADLGAAYSVYAELAKRGQPIPPGISMLKVWSTETYERLALLLIESAQDYGALRDHCKSDEIDMHVVAPLFNALGAKIFAGSNEIQRNILAKAVLELPS